MRLYVIDAVDQGLSPSFTSAGSSPEESRVCEFKNKIFFRAGGGRAEDTLQPKGGVPKILFVPVKSKIRPHWRPLARAQVRMPRGGNGKPDGFSPYKAADGRELRLLKSTNSQNGYFNVIKVRKKFYPKAKLDGVQGSGVQKTFGKGQATAREAAIVLADYTDKPYELTVAGEV